MERADSQQSSYRPEAAQWARSFFIALLPVFAVFLGGGTSKWAEGIIVGLLGIFLIFQPPRRSLGWMTNVTFIALALCSLVSFLPQDWLFIPGWRTALTDDFGIGLPNTLTPQPWITAGCFVSLIAALCWLYRCSAQELELRVARFQLRLFASGIVIIAALSILLYLTHHSMPFWRNERGFGPFPNRNQTADLFGITSVLILAAGQDNIRHHRNRWVFWAVALIIIIIGIVLNFSRAGVVILVAASAVWVMAIALRTGSGVRIALAASFFLLLLSALLISGGSTLERFHLQKFAGTDFPSDFRWLIFSDAWKLIRSSPWCGIGLGNFEPVFAIFRDASRGNTRAYHPESDWLWVWAELGVLAPIIIVIGAALLIRRVAPLPVGSNQRFRIAALIGALMFALHGVVDVSGHRVGTAYSSLFLLGLSLHRPLHLPPSKVVPWLFRAVGLALLVIGASWTMSWRTMALLPGTTGVANAKQLATIASRGRNFTEAIGLTTRALQWAPLDWELYYLRAVAQISADGSVEKALDDFRRARFLEPNSYAVPLQEGLVWLSVRPALSAVAWREAFRRAGPNRSEVFRSIIFATQRNATARPVIEQLAFSQHDLALTYLAELAAPEFRLGLQKLLATDPELATLKAGEKRRLFEFWETRGEPLTLVAAVDQHPAWLPYAWRAVAKSRGAAGDFRGACELMEKFSGAVALPPMQAGQTIEQLRTQVYRDSNNFTAGYTLYREQINRGLTDDALATVRHFTAFANAPPYFHFLEAQAWAAKRNWERSWNAWVLFEKTRVGVP